jgi:2-keto-3-deoxy-6-phosphogluconate aldolase
LDESTEAMSIAEIDILGKIVSSGLVENVADWISAGSVAVGVGGNLTAEVKSGDFASITPVARQFMEKIKKARGQ